MSDSAGTRSVWQAEAPVFASAPAPTPCDVAIVGAGIAGASAAYALRTLASGLRVAVLEAHAPAWGASGRNAGFLLTGTSHDYAAAVDAYGRDRARRLWAFTAEAVRRTAHPVLAAGGAWGGSVLAAGQPAEAGRLERSRDLLAADGFEAELLRGRAVAERTGLAGFATALVVATGGLVDPLRLVRACLAASGAAVATGWRLAALEADPGGVRLRADDGREVVAGCALLALGAHVGTVVPALAPLARPVRAQMLATEAVGVSLPFPVYSHEGHFYLRAHAGRLLLGGARHLWADQEVGLEDATTPHLQHDLEAYLARHLPAAAGARVARRWSGAMSFSPDGLPVLGEVPGVPGAWWAGGFTGHGMGYGLRFGELAARRLLGRADPDADLFDPARLDAMRLSNSSGAPA